MKTSKEIRLANFLTLAKKHKFIKDFCQVIGIEPTYYTQVKDRVKGIGNMLARRVEERLCLPNGWMDVEHKDVENHNAPHAPVGGHHLSDVPISVVIDCLPDHIADNLKRLIFSIASEVGKQRDIP